MDATRPLKNRHTVSLTAAAVAILGMAVATAIPASGATGPSTGGTKLPVPTQVVKIEKAPYAPVRESVAQFLQKAHINGVTIPARDMARLKAAQATPSSTSCWYWNDWRKGVNLFGVKMWQFNVEPNWCGNGNVIISHAYTRVWGDTPGPGWRYHGVTQEADRGGVGSRVFESIRKGSFCLSTNFGCIQTQHPYIDVEVGAGGQIIKS